MLPHSAATKLYNKDRGERSQQATAFAGFTLPTSNTTYTPNQFFDVCLPHRSRGAVRLVGYMIRKTLGWCDANGNPQHETIAVSYNELENKAGVGHSMIRSALNEAERGGFIRCIRTGHRSSRTVSGTPAEYELAWDECGHYIKAPASFSGFFAGEGNRTYIPNQFFDCLLPNERLAVIQVVGSIIRFSIGFQNRYGHRRQRVALSYRDIQRYAKIASPSVIAKALREAVAKNYIERVEDGYFDPNGGRLSRSAHYAVKWSQPSGLSPTTPKTVAGEIEVSDHSENRSGSTPIFVAADHSEKRSDIQIKETNNILKQQANGAGTLERLRAEGFDERAARAIANRYPAERIQRQINWIDRRRIKANRLGMLRAAIDQDWADPGALASGEAKLGRPNFSRPAGLSFEDAIRQARERLQNKRY